MFDQLAPMLDNLTDEQLLRSKDQLENFLVIIEKKLKDKGLL